MLLVAAIAAVLMDITLVTSRTQSFRALTFPSRPNDDRFPFQERRTAIEHRPKIPYHQKLASPDIQPPG